MFRIGKSVLLISLLFSCKTLKHDSGLSELSSIEKEHELDLYSFKPLNIPNPVSVADLKTIKKEKREQELRIKIEAVCKKDLRLLMCFGMKYYLMQ